MHGFVAVGMTAACRRSPRRASTRRRRSPYSRLVSFFGQRCIPLQIGHQVEGEAALGEVSLILGGIEGDAHVINCYSNKSRKASDLTS